MADRFTDKSSGGSNSGTPVKTAKSTARGSVKIGGGIGQIATFMGRRPPTEVKNLVEILVTIQDIVFKRIVQFVVEHLKGTEITEEKWQMLLAKSKGLQEKDARTVFAGSLVILKTAARDRIEATTFMQDLEQLTIVGPQAQVYETAFKELYVFNFLKKLKVNLIFSGSQQFWIKNLLPFLVWSLWIIELMSLLQLPRWTGF